MSKSRICLALGALLASGLCLAEDAKVAPAGTAPAAAPTAPAPTATFATINGVAYPVALFQAIAAERLQRTPVQSEQELQEVKQLAWQDFQTIIVGAQEAEKRKLQDNPDVVTATKTALDLQRMKILYSAALASMAQELKVSDDELKKGYEEYKKAAARTEFKVRHILVKEEADAKKIIKDLEKGADFEDVAKKKSVATNAKEDGGALPWFDETSPQYKPFADAAAKMKPGTYSKEPVQTQYGWHILNLQETRPAEPRKFDDIKAELTAFIQRQKLTEEFNKLLKAAVVKPNEEIVKITPNKDGAAAPAK